MAYSGSFVTTKGGGLNGYTTPAIDTTGKDIIFRAIVYAPGSTPVLSDFYTNTWIGLGATQDTGGALATQIYYAVNPVVGAGHTFTVAGAVVVASEIVGAFSGAKLTSPFDTGIESGATVIGTSLAPGPITPTENDEIVIIGFAYNGLQSLAIDGGFTIVDQQPLVGGSNYGSMMGFLIQTTAGAANPSTSWTGSQTACVRSAAFKAAATASDTLMSQAWM